MRDGRGMKEAENGRWDVHKLGLLELLYQLNLSCLIFSFNIEVLMLKELLLE